MLNELFLRNRSLMAIATIGLCCSTPQAVAGGGLMPGLRATSGLSAAAQVLPAVRNPRPYRNTRIATCDRNLAAFGFTNGCLMSFGKVPAGHLLQAENINCGGVNFVPQGAILFNSALKVDATHLAAGIPRVSDTGNVIAAGPFFFNQGEIPRIVMAGSAATDQTFCTIAGTLWRTP